MVKADLKEILTQILAELGISDIEPVVERTSDMSHGDYSTNIALVAFKKYQVFKTPLELAEEIIDRIKKQDSRSKNIQRIEVAGVGFINFWLSREELFNSIEYYSSSEDAKRRVEKLESENSSRLPMVARTVSNIQRKKVIVEYSSPNIAKPFTIGHLRSTIIGDTIANLLEFAGWEVYRDSHVGDWGTQFGKQIYAIKTWGNMDEISKSENPVSKLVELYVKFHEEAEKDPSLEDEARIWFKKLEDGDLEARSLWEKCIEWSFKEFSVIYEKLGVKFTENEGRGYGESFFEDKMDDVITELKEKGFLQPGKEGAQIVEFDSETKLPSLMILKKDGATLYSTRDLATDKFRLEKYGQDIMIINEVGAEQSLYFQQLYKLEEMLGWYRLNQRIHVRHGLYRFKDEKMSTRRGNVIWLEEVLNEAINRAKKLQKEEDLDIDKDKLASVVGVGALKWNDLKRDSSQDIVFDWDDILNMEGNSGPYLQYTYARTQSVLHKPQATSHKSQATSHKLMDEESTLLRMLYFFSESVIEAAEKYSPNILCNYLYNLAQSFNLFYQKHSILNPELHPELDSGSPEMSDSIRDFRLALTEAVGKTIKKGLNLLGIEAPERM